VARAAERGAWFFLFAGLLWGPARRARAGAARGAPARLAGPPAAFRRRLVVALRRERRHDLLDHAAVSKHLSYKGCSRSTSRSSARGAEIGRYHVPGQLSEYAQTTDLPSLASLFEFLAKPKRVCRDRLGRRPRAIDQHAKAGPGVPEGGANYYVVDDSNSRFIMLFEPARRRRGRPQPAAPLRGAVAAAPPQHEVHADFEGKLELVGYDLPNELERGRTFKIVMYYKVKAPLTSPYKVFLHFDGSGTRFNGDHVPLGASSR